MMRKNTQTITLCAVLTAAALVLSLVESALPLQAVVPLPGVKLGLSNVVTLFAVYRLGGRPALAISLCRVLLLFLLSGSVTALFMSLCGALLSLGGMLAARRLAGKFLSVLGVSVVGAACHGIGQILCAMVLTGGTLVFYYLPTLLLSAVPCGLLTGVCAAGLLKKL